MAAERAKASASSALRAPFGEKILLFTSPCFIEEYRLYTWIEEGNLITFPASSSISELHQDG